MFSLCVFALVVGTTLGHPWEHGMMLVMKNGEVQHSRWASRPGCDVETPGQDNNGNPLFDGHNDFLPQGEQSAHIPSDPVPASSGGGGSAGPGGPEGWGGAGGADPSSNGGGAGYPAGSGGGYPAGGGGGYPAGGNGGYPAGGSGGYPGGAGAGSPGAEGYPNGGAGGYPGAGTGGNDSGYPASGQGGLPEAGTDGFPSGSAGQGGAGGAGLPGGASGGISSNHGGGSGEHDDGKGNDTPPFSLAGRKGTPSYNVFFPVQFTNRARGAEGSGSYNAIANSFATGRKGIANSHAAALGDAGAGRRSHQ